jgi:ATP-binding cassette subfamily F protein 3
VSASRKGQKRQEAELRQVRYRERKIQQDRVSALETRIHTLEARQQELITGLEQPDTYGKPGLLMDMNRELVSIQDELAKLNSEWESEATRLSEILSDTPAAS